MKLLRRTPLDPAVIAAQAAAQQAAAHAAIEQARLQAQLDRELREAAAEEARIKAAADEQERRRRDEARRQERSAARDRRRKGREEFLTKLRPVLPLLLINAGAAYAQAAYAYADIAPADWQWTAKLTFAIAFAAALESIAVYVQWHAHDALLLKAYGTAAKLRRASWVIAGIVGVINYAHFADGWKPTAAAVAFALLSLLSPWLWGLHTRRAQHVQLLAEDANLIDEGGVEFSTQRRRAFPIRSWQAQRWSIDHFERDPRKAWEGYNAERRARTTSRPAAGVRPPVGLLAAGLATNSVGILLGGAVGNALGVVALVVNATFIVLVLRARQTPQVVDVQPDGDDPDEPVDPWEHAEPISPQPAPVQVSTARARGRWRTPLHRRPRRMARPQPQITVVLPEATPAPKTPRPAAKSGGSAARPGRPSKAQKVVAAAAKMPGAKPAEIAAVAKVSPDTVRRHLAAATAVNGHNHSKGDA
ncbi:hypothetical protein ACQSSU_06515 [Micromonospora echinospora]